MRWTSLPFTKLPIKNLNKQNLGFKKAQHRGTVKLKFLYLATSERIRFHPCHIPHLTMKS